MLKFRLLTQALCDRQFAMTRAASGGAPSDVALENLHVQASGLKRT
jgi:hypothetical protein